MTLEEFVLKYTGKGIDFDGHYGFQCVDLYRQYVQEVVKCPQSPGVSGAKDIWDSYLPDYFERIPNTPEGVPQAGDIMIWGDKYGPYGHVAVVTKATLTTFTCFSQNDPTGALSGLKTYRTYSPTLGWLSPKTPSTSYRGYDLTNLDSMKVCVDDHVKVVEGQLIDKSQYEAVKGQFTESKKTNEALSIELGSARSELKTALDSAKTAKEALQNELGDQLDYADKWEDEQTAHGITKNLLSNTLWDIEDSLKLSHPSDDMESRISVALGALHSQIQTNISYEKQVKDLESKNTKLSKYKVGIDKLSIKDCIMLIIDKLKELL